jgi:hypothetical protein
MDENNKNLEVTPEEQKAEQEAQAEVKEDELRDKLASDFGIDPEDEEKKEFLDKLVANEKSHREKLSGAIKQKITWRTKFQETSKKPEGQKPKDGKPDKEMPNIDELVDRKLNERLEARDLESLGLSDDLKAEVKDLAKLKGISVRDAAQLPYIKARKEEVEREERIKKATPKRSNSGSYTPSYDPSKPLNPDDFDMNTEEGRKAWKEAKETRAKYRAQHKS